jgi:acyl-[acyl-carrier-protein]-phospholipid O-acyltransferase/long-chain-fatty-acid--[acyl-carrier-protein] ligase
MRIKRDKSTIDSNTDAYQKMPELNEHLGNICFRSLTRKLGMKLITDRTSEQRREFSAGKLLAVSVVLSRKWKDEIPGNRVGIVLPPGIGAIITNLALVLIGKIPVNLNFTIGRRVNESCIRKAGIETVITAQAVRERMPDFPWVEDTRDLVLELKSVSKLAIISWLTALYLLPSNWLARFLDIPREGGEKEAAILFSSGSTGEPKGVILTHRNIISNCLQISHCGLFCEDEILMACLPLFHSFGFTVTVWFPLITNLRIVTLPSPLEIKRIAKAINEEQVTVLLGTPTFFRPYYKTVNPELLKSLIMVIGGAEKTPPDFKKKWEEKFGSLYLEGYGLTETAPVVSVNVPDKNYHKTFGNSLPGTRVGSVGRLFPGMRGRIADTDTGEIVSPFDTGVLHLQGPNIFPGYLDDIKNTALVFADKWFVTGDLARFDKDGFLYIEGRLSRFSKIGGEMVPHGFVEQCIIEAYGYDDSDSLVVAVTGTIDEVKGESLVLLTTIEIDRESLRERMSSAKLPNLWIPRKIIKVDIIPCLASGKLDLKALDKLTQQV